MGNPFSGEYQDFASVSTIPLNEEAFPVILRAVTIARNNDVSTSSVLASSIISSMGVTSENFYRYADKPDDYIEDYDNPKYFYLGLPTGSIVDLDRLRQFLENLVNSAIPPPDNTYVYPEIYFGSLPATWFLRMVVPQWDYISDSVQLSLNIDESFPIDYTCRIYSAQYINNATGLKYRLFWDRNEHVENAPYVIQISDYYQIPLNQVWQAVYTNSTFNPYRDYIYGYFKPSPTSNVTAGFAYEYGSGGLPDVDNFNIYTAISGMSAFYYPIVPIRTVFTFIDEYATYDGWQEHFSGYMEPSDTLIAYETSKEILRKLNIKLDDIIEQFKGGDTPNPNLDKVYAGFLLFACPLVTDKETLIEYNYNYFKALEGAAKYDRRDWAAALDAEQANELIYPFPKLNGFQIVEEYYNIEVAFIYVHTEIIQVPYPLGDIGSWHMFVPTIDDPEYTTLSRSNDQGELNSKSYNISWLIYAQQISPTSVKALEVRGLSIRHGIQTANSGYQVIQSTVSHNSRLTYAIEGNKNLAVPINRGIAANLNVLDKAALFEMSLSLQVYAIDTQYVRWYENSFWSFLITFVIMVFTIYTAGQAGGLLDTLGTALALGSYKLAALIILDAVLVSYVVSELARFAIDSFGLEGTLIAVIAYQLVMMYVGEVNINLGDIANASLKLTASTLLESVNLIGYIIKEATTIFSADLQGEYAKFRELVEEQQEELDAMEAAGLPETVKMFAEWHLNTGMLLNDTPETYIKRTTMTNAGQLVIDAVYNYTKIATTVKPV